ncbi:MAG: hypothetical protein ACRDQZ_20770, partial [Mycobacteriales bacterium]
MSISAWDGPAVIASGSDANPELGMSLFTQGFGILDPRPYYTYNRGQNFGSLTAGWLGTKRILGINAIPFTKTVNLIAALQHITNGTPLTLASANASGLGVGAAITRADTGVAVSGLLVIDPPVASVTASLVSGSNVLNVTASTIGTTSLDRLRPGMVLTDSTTGGNIPTGATILAGPYQGQPGTGGGYTGTYFMSAAATATAASDTVTGIFTGWPNTFALGAAGTINMFDPGCMLSRALIITASSASAATTTFTIQGFDVYGYAMVETITVTPGSAVSTNGKKAWKYIQSITPNATDATFNFEVGTTDIIGFPIRSDSFQAVFESDVGLMANNAQIASATGYVAAVLTTPTATTGDVRGTYALQTASNGTL